MRVCIADGCKRRRVAKGFCHKHYRRWRVHGDPSVVGVPRRNPRKGADHPGWVAVPSYSNMHLRLRAELGRAGDLVCSCGDAAYAWSYMGGDSEELLGQSGQGSWCMYSTSSSFYEPLCHKCHCRKDKTRTAEELREWREIKTLTRLSGQEIREKLGVS